MPEPLEFLVDRIPTPIGELTIISDEEERLRCIDWTDHQARAMGLLNIQYRRAIILNGKRDAGGFSSALRAYFDGDIGAIDKLEVTTAGTEFQRSVWKMLRSIDRGKTLSYGELARRIGRPSAVRAVGHANGSNPISIVVPCHRVIGSNGTLTGYGGGVERKRWLLKHEGYEVE